MIKIIKNSLFASLVILACSGNASENSHQSIFNSRPLSQELRDLMEKSRKEEAQLEQKAVGDLSSIVQISDQATVADLSLSVFHSVRELPAENILKIEDGSEWMFDLSDAQIIRNWEKDDPVVITPKGWWFWDSNYNYVLTNQETNESIKVNLYDHPIEFGQQTTWIIGLDRNNAHVYTLSAQGERMVWEISQKDLYLFQEWKVNDTLIFGKNDSWLWYFSDHNHIIINVDSNHYVRARSLPLTPYLCGISMKKETQ